MLDEHGAVAAARCGGESAPIGLLDRLCAAAEALVERSREEDAREDALAAAGFPVVVDGGDAASRDSRRRGFRWETVRAILATPGPRKVTIDLKPQLRAMGAAEGTLAGVVAAPVVDVRVAAWLLRPEAPTLACGSSGAWHKTEDIARAFKGDLDEKAIREAARWKLGGLATNRAHAAAAGSALAAAVALAADVAFRARAASESRRPSVCGFM